MGESTRHEVAGESTSTGGAERRIFPRVPVSTAVTISSQSNFYAGLTENVSVGGLFAITDFTLPVGTFLELTVALPDGLPPLAIMGQVRWIRESPPQGLGVRFERLGPTETQRIEAFVAQRPPIFSKGRR